jgi:antitoxin VapB
MHIDDPQVERLVRCLAADTGETPRDALLHALEERLAKCRQAPRREKDSGRVFDAIIEISRRCSALPDLDRRTAAEILAYNAAGAPE